LFQIVPIVPNGFQKFQRFRKFQIDREATAPGGAKTNWGVIFSLTGGTEKEKGERKGKGEEGKAMRSSFFLKDLPFKKEEGDFERPPSIVCCLCLSNCLKAATPS
jgi:hypothetical protein